MKFPGIGKNATKTSKHWNFLAKAQELDPVPSGLIIVPYSMGAVEEPVRRLARTLALHLLIRFPSGFWRASLWRAVLDPVG